MCVYHADRGVVENVDIMESSTFRGKASTSKSYVYRADLLQMLAELMPWWVAGRSSVEHDSASMKGGIVGLYKQRGRVQGVVGRGGSNGCRDYPTVTRRNFEGIDRRR